MKSIRIFKLSDRRRSARGFSRGLACDEDGVFLGDVPLAVPEIGESGCRVYRTRFLDDISRLLSAGYGIPVDFTSRMPGLRQTARYMSEGKWVLAKIAAVQLRMPDLPDDESVIRLQKAAGLRRFNPNHYPANSGRGGQFAPTAQGDDGPKERDSDQGGASSEQDVTGRKFANEIDAARFALRRFYDESRRSGVEYAGVIYRRGDGTYRITAPSTAADGNTENTSVVRWDHVPTGMQVVASYHTHLPIHHGLYAGQDEEFNTFDRFIARNSDTRSYIGTPKGRLRMYDGRTRQEKDLGSFR
jgi:Domain of unknown function (DUF4329)